MWLSGTSRDLASKLRVQSAQRHKDVVYCHAVTMQKDMFAKCSVLFENILKVCAVITVTALCSNYSRPLFEKNVSALFSSSSFDGPLMFCFNTEKLPL